MEHNKPVGFVEVGATGFVPPHIPSVLSGGTEGTVLAGGAIELDELDDVCLKLRDPNAISKGTRVYVKRGRGTTLCKPLSERTRELERREAEREIVEAQATEELNEMRREANEFWAGYDIPVDVDVAIKGRRSGLLRGSSGTGRDGRTVEHCYVLESFTDGRLERDANVYLCSDGARFRFDDRVRKEDGDGNTYMPAVTCSACLDLMERWEIDQ